MSAKLPTKERVHAALEEAASTNGLRPFSRPTLALAESMRKHGLVSASVAGIYRITPRGRAELAHPGIEEGRAYERRHDESADKAFAIANRAAASAKFDRLLHLARVGSPDYALHDFATRDYYNRSLLPSLKRLAKEERRPMQGIWDWDVGVWTMMNAENQPRNRAFVIVDADGKTHEGPRYDPAIIDWPHKPTRRARKRT